MFDMLPAATPYLKAKAKATPAPIIAKLNEAINRALKEPDLAQRITGPGNVISGGTPEEFAGFVAAEAQRWPKVVKDMKISPE